MLKCVFIFTFLFCLRVSATSYSQNVRVSLDIKNMELKKALSLLEKKSNLRFLYSEEVLPVGKQITINVKDAWFQEVMLDFLKDTELKFQVLDNNLVVIAPRGTEIKDTKVKGKVTDENGEPLPGVSIKIEGTKSGTTTGPNGNYELTVTDGARLTFSYIGFTAQTIDVNGKTTINVVLKLNAAGQQLTEVVVVGYGTQKRSDITGSVVSIPKARLSEIPVTNVLQAIEGAVPGVNITTTSSIPGSKPTATIRGQNSINGGSDPFVVVDGIPLSKSGGSLNDINPNDIASIEVLKDASATAIYGMNGSNGVILVTTKRGSTGKPIISYNPYFGLENLAHVLQPRSAADYVQKYADFLTATGQKQTSPVPNYGELANYNNGTVTDWIKETTQQGVWNDQNVSVRGGSDDVKYLVSGDYLNQKGVIKGYQFTRVSFRTNIDVNITSFLSAGVSAFVANNNTDGGRANLFSATAMSPYGQEYNADGTYAIYPMNPEQLYTNPLLGLTTDRIQRSANINGNGFAEIKFGGIVKGLKFRVNAGYTFLPERTSTYTGRAANDLLGTASNFYAQTNSYTLENLLTYTKDWKKNHIDLTTLYSSSERNYSNSTAGAVGFVNDALSFNNLNAGATQTSSSYTDRYANNSQMARLNYAYDSRYLFTATARRDGSSVFGANTSKYGVFPSVAVGWNVINEKFMKKVSFFDNLKLRLSYGKTGNEGIGVYGTVTTDNAVRYPFNGVSTIGAVAGNLGNDNLHWENTSTANLGIDFGILKNRISGSIDIYNAKTADLLLKRGLPIITGYPNVYDNIGKTSNNGIEISINTHNIDLKGFKWETGIVFAANKNKIVDLYGDGKSDVGNRWFIGQPISVVYDYQMTGVWQTGEDASKQDPGAKPGDLKFADIASPNGSTPDGKITADDKIVLGQTAPKWTGGITNTFHYKNFNLSVFIQTAQGMIRSNTDLNYADESGRRNTPAEIGYWTPANQSNTRPALSYNNTRGYSYPSDASYTRIKDATLSYIFSPKLLNQLHMGGLTVYASGRNIYTFTKWIGWDPESNYFARGVNGYLDNYPVTRTFILGANISLK